MRKYVRYNPNIDVEQLFVTDVRSEQTKKRRGIRYEHIGRKKKREKNPRQSHEKKKRTPQAYSDTCSDFRTCHYLFDDVLYCEDESPES